MCSESSQCAAQPDAPFSHYFRLSSLFLDALKRSYFPLSLSPTYSARDCALCASRLVCIEAIVLSCPPPP